MPPSARINGKRRHVTESLLERIARGDRTAVADCIEAYSGLVWTLARRFLSNDADAEEAVQEIFMEIWQRADRYDRSVAGEATFVSMIARRRLIDRSRKLAREPGSEPLDEARHSLSEDSQRFLEASADMQRVVGVLQTLGAEQQEVINMASWLGMSHGAIAEHTGIPLGTVKSYITRGLLKIREALGETEIVGKVQS